MPEESSQSNIGAKTSSNAEVGQVACHWAEVFAGCFIELLPCHCLFVILRPIFIVHVVFASITASVTAIVDIIIDNRIGATIIRANGVGGLAGGIVGHKVTELSHLKFSLFLFYLYNLNYAAGL